MHLRRLALALALSLLPAALASAEEEVPASKSCRALPGDSKMKMSLTGATLVDLAQVVSRMTCTSFSFAVKPTTKFDLPPDEVRVDRMLALFTKTAEKQGLKVVSLGEGRYRVE